MELRTVALDSERLYRLLRTLDKAAINGDADYDEDEDGTEYFTGADWCARYRFNAGAREIVVYRPDTRDSATTYEER